MTEPVAQYAASCTACAAPNLGTRFCESCGAPTTILSTRVESPSGPQPEVTAPLTSAQSPDSLGAIGDSLLADDRSSESPSKWLAHQWAKRRPLVIVAALIVAGGLGLVVMPAISGLVAAGSRPVEALGESGESSGSVEFTNPVVLMSNPDVPATLNGAAAGSVTGFVGATDYSFDLDFSVRLGVPSSSIVNAPPGTADLTWDVPLFVTATNSTPGRVASWADLQGFQFVAAWPTGAQLCTSVRGQDLWGTTKIGGSDYCVVTVRTIGSGMEGQFGVGETRTLNADRSFAFQVPENEVAAVMSELTVGPTAWLLVNSAVSGAAPCQLGGRAIAWASTPAVGCTPPGAYTAGGASVTPEQVAQATRVIHSAIEAAETAALDIFTPLPSCPVAATPRSLIAGLPSPQTLEWGGEYSPKDSRSWAGLRCQDAAMWVTVMRPDDRWDPLQYLANDEYSEWPSFSNVVAMHNGSAVVGVDTITPLEGEPYQVVRCAWFTDGLIILAALPRGDAASGMQWLNYNLPSMINSISVWAWEP